MMIVNDSEYAGNDAWLMSSINALSVSLSSLIVVPAVMIVVVPSLVVVVIVEAPGNVVMVVVAVVNVVDEPGVSADVVDEPVVSADVVDEPVVEPRVPVVVDVGGASVVTMIVDVVDGSLPSPPHTSY
jgi:hypothetical protein